jgi:hypothetical protein
MSEYGGCNMDYWVVTGLGQWRCWLRLTAGKCCAVSSYMTQDWYA